MHVTDVNWPTLGLAFTVTSKERKKMRLIATIVIDAKYMK